VWRAAAHAGWARGVACSPKGDRFVTVGDDKRAKLWALEVRGAASGSGGGGGGPAFPSWGSAGGAAADEPTPLAAWAAPSALLSVSHHARANQFATCGAAVWVYDTSRSTPVSTLEWGADSVHHVAFNPSERALLATCAQDRTVCLHDLRAGSSMVRVTMQMKANCVSWNPRAPFVFAVGSEDHDAYSFDMRRPDKPLLIHRDHQGAVMDIAWNPTGREFASASYDKTVRLFDAKGGRSRDVYHTKRMQRVFACHWTQDSKYVISGSDDTNLRIWKARASEALGTVPARKAEAMKYAAALQERHAAVPEVRRIKNQRFVPKMIKKSKELKAVQSDKRRRKGANVQKHSKSGAAFGEEERRKVMVRVEGVAEASKAPEASAGR